MSGFTKLFSSIVDSTIWREDPFTKVVWVTMLAKADRNGTISMSLPGLADAARVSMDQCKAALAIFLAPDEYSRTKDFDGRRIMETEGGWILLNYMKYRKIQDEDQKRIATADRVRRHREKLAGKDPVTQPVTNVTLVTPGNAIAEAEAEAEAETEEVKKKKTCTKPGKPASAPDASPVLMSLPCVGSGPQSWPVTESTVAKWKEAFPGVDPLGEARKMALWLEANPPRRKTHAGMGRFALAWLGRAQDSAKPTTQGANNGTNQQHRFTGRDEALRRQLAEQPRSTAPAPTDAEIAEVFDVRG